jgi:hypothetical protein
MVLYAILADSCRADGIAQMAPDDRPNRNPQRLE